MLRLLCRVRICKMVWVPAGVIVVVLLAAGWFAGLLGRDHNRFDYVYSELPPPGSMTQHDQLPSTPPPGRRADDGAGLPGWVVRRPAEVLLSTEPRFIWNRVRDGLQQLAQMTLTQPPPRRIPSTANSLNSLNSRRPSGPARPMGLDANAIDRDDVADAKDCLDKIAAAVQGPPITASDVGGGGGSSNRNEDENERPLPHTGVPGAYDIVVGVLSARGNAEQRDALRSTWVGAANTAADLRDRVHARFVVGGVGCTIPVEDREDPLGCTPRYNYPYNPPGTLGGSAGHNAWLQPHTNNGYAGYRSATRDVRIAKQAATPLLDTPIFAHVLPTAAAASGTLLPGWPGVGSDFRLYRWISVSHLGLYDHNLDGFQQPITVKLWNRDTKAKAAEATFSKARAGELRGCHRYIALDPPLSLPAGFRGTLTLSPAAGSGTSINEPMVWWEHAVARDHNVVHDGGGVVHFMMGGRYSASPNAFPELLVAPSAKEGGLLGAAGRFPSATFVYTSPLEPPSVQQGLQWQRGATYVDTAVELGLGDSLELKWGSGPAHGALPRPALSAALTVVQLRDERCFSACSLEGHAPAGVVSSATPTNTFTTQLLQGAALGVGVHYLSATSPHDCKQGMKFKLTVVDRVQASAALFDPVAVKARRKAQALTVAAEAQALQLEVAAHNDLIILPDHLDTYAGLPLKLLRFFQWSQQLPDFKFAMKTDDDCLVDIRGVLSSYDQLNLGGGGGGGGGGSKHVWWSDFRVGWPVARSGKWKEAEYTAEHYPAFGCGSGSMLSKTSVKWLGSNADHLHSSSRFAP